MAPYLILAFVLIPLGLVAAYVWRNVVNDLAKERRRALRVAEQESVKP